SRYGLTEGVAGAATPLPCSPSRTPSRRPERRVNGGGTLREASVFPVQVAIQGSWQPLTLAAIPFSPIPAMILLDFRELGRQQRPAARLNCDLGHTNNVVTACLML